ncbi:MAG: NCS2 family permease [Candidatus Methanomethylophilaceae archaeon]|nr:NCS2 family permease [Candidatus Methanomethylophilaceae archaeon]
MSGVSERIDHFFHITERGSTIGTEVRGGLITFLAMFYIMAVNPLILQEAAGPELFGQLVTATGLAAFVSSILMGIYARFPVALAPGMGINAFIAYTIVIAMGFTYYQALLVVLISGIIFLVLTVTGVRKKLLSSIPAIVRLAITAGIGFFIVLVGLYNSGIIIHGEGSALQLGDIASPGVNLSIMCIIITLILWYKKLWYAVLVGVVFSVAFGFMGGQLFGWDTTIDGTSLIPGVGTAAVTELISMPDFGLFGAMFTEFTMFDSSLIPAFLASVVALLIVDMFDTAGTLLGIGQVAGIIDEDGNIEGNEKALQTDAVGSIFGAIAGTTTTTSFIESSTGIASGARTGLMAVTVGILFFVALFFVPLFSIITSACTVGALVLVGLMMITTVKDIEWTEPVNIATAFLTMFMMALSGSITDGIAFGLLAYLLGMLVTKRYKEVPLIIWILGLIFLGYFYLTYGIIPSI